MCQPCSLAFIRARLSVRPKDVSVLNVHNSHLKKAFLNVPTREDLPRLLFYIMWISFLMSVFEFCFCFYCCTFELRLQTQIELAKRKLECLFCFFFSVPQWKSLAALLWWRPDFLLAQNYPRTREKGGSAETQAPYPTWMRLKALKACPLLIAWPHLVMLWVQPSWKLIELPYF